MWRGSGCWRLFRVGPIPPSAAAAEILERLRRLEEANRALVAEVPSLRSELAAAPAGRRPGPRWRRRPSPYSRTPGRRTGPEQGGVSRNGFRSRLTGMALLNAFHELTRQRRRPVSNRRRGRLRAHGRRHLRQSVIGPEYRGPETVWGGKVHGSLLLDLYGGKRPVAGPTCPPSHRIGDDRLEAAQLPGRHRKAHVAPREPNSLAQVGVSPLTGAGNLWLWTPQVRFEQGVQFAGQCRGSRADRGCADPWNSTSAPRGDMRRM